jgi:phage gp36-like protein
MSTRTLYITVDEYKEKEGVRALRQATPQTDATTGETVSGQLVDDSRVLNTIIKASDYIDSILGGTFTVPLTLPVPGIIEEITVHIVNEWITKDDLSASRILDPEQPPLSTLIAIINGTIPVPGITRATAQFTAFDSIPDEVEENRNCRYYRNFETGCYS